MQTRYKKEEEPHPTLSAKDRNFGQIKNTKKSILDILRIFPNELRSAPPNSIIHSQQ